MDVSIAASQLDRKQYRRQKLARLRAKAAARAAELAEHAHPLDPLSADELERVVDIVQRHPDYRYGMRFGMVSLKEPARSESEAPRSAEVILIDNTSRGSFRVDVDLHVPVSSQDSGDLEFKIQARTNEPDALKYLDRIVGRLSDLGIVSILSRMPKGTYIASADRDIEHGEEFLGTYVNGKFYGLDLSTGEWVRGRPMTKGSGTRKQAVKQPAKPAKRSRSKGRNKGKGRAK